MSDLLYGDPVFVASTVSSWRGSFLELRQLATMEELGMCEYR